MGTRPRLGSKRFRELNLRLSQGILMNMSQEIDSLSEESNKNVKFEPVKQ